MLEFDAEQLKLVDKLLKEQRKSIQQGSVVEDFNRCYDLEFRDGYSLHCIIWDKKGHMHVGIPFKTFIVRDDDHEIIFSAAFGRGCKYRSEFLAKEACMNKINEVIGG